MTTTFLFNQKTRANILMDNSFIVLTRRASLMKGHIKSGCKRNKQTKPIKMFPCFKYAAMFRQIIFL